MGQNQYSKYREKENRGSHMPIDYLEGPIYPFATKYSMMLKALPKVKTMHSPKFNTMFVRKFMILVYLAGIEKEQGFFSILSLRDHFRQSTARYAEDYFLQLTREGWALPVLPQTPKQIKAVLSPLFFSLIQSITNTLRREYPERFKAHDLAALSPEIKAMKPESSVFDFVTAIPDLR